jgi:branched-chain amino acid transport system permease protein
MILLTLEKSENLAQSIGINTFKYKTIAFIIGSFFAGLAGAVFATFYHYIGPEDFSIHQTFYVLIYVLTGGVNTIYGAIIGVFALIMALKLIHHLPGFNPVWEPLFLGGTLLIIMKFLPGGIISIPQKISLKNLVLNWRKKGGLA